MMDSFISKGGRIDTVRSTQPSKSPRVTRDDGSRGNKQEYHQQQDDPVDELDIHVSDQEKAQEADGQKEGEFSTISLKTIREAMITQARQQDRLSEADPIYNKALLAYQAYLSHTEMVAELPEIDTQGEKTQFGKLNDLIKQDFDIVNIKSGQSYDELITDLWNQIFSAS